MFSNADEGLDMLTKVYFKFPKDMTPPSSYYYSKYSELEARIIWNRLGLRVFEELDVGIPNWFFISVYRDALKVINELLRRSVILIYADYDPDGLLGGYCFYHYLRYVKRNPYVYFYAQNRYEGYNISIEVIEKFIKNNGVNFVVIVDNGTNRIPELIPLAHRYRVYFLIVDHHVPDPQLPFSPFIFLINPRMLYERIPELEEPSSGLLIVHLILALESFERNESLIYRDRELLEYYFALAGVTLATDVMPLTPYNHKVLRHTIKFMNSERVRNYPLFYYFADDEKRFKGKITINTITFRIGPTLNTPGRFGEIDKAVAFLMEQTPELYKEIYELNRYRRMLVARVANEVLYSAYKENNLRVVELRNQDAKKIQSHLAGMVANAYEEPALVYSRSDNKVSGSIRLPFGYKFANVRSFITECKELGVEDIGGHEKALGFSCDVKVFDELVGKINSSLVEEERGYFIDGFLNFSDMNDLEYMERLHNLIDSLHPFDDENFQKVILAIGPAKILDIRERGDGRKAYFEVLYTHANRERGVYSVKYYTHSLLLKKKGEILKGVLGKPVWLIVQKSNNLVGEKEFELLDVRFTKKWGF